MRIARRSTGVAVTGAGDLLAPSTRGRSSPQKILGLGRRPNGVLCLPKAGREEDLVRFRSTSRGITPISTDPSGGRRSDLATRTSYSRPGGQWQSRRKGGGDVVAGQALLRRRTRSALKNPLSQRSVIRSRKTVVAAADPAAGTGYFGPRMATENRACVETFPSLTSWVEHRPTTPGKGLRRPSRTPNVPSRL